MATRRGGASVTTAGSPEQIGPFRVLRTLGTGGMGTVYLAVGDTGEPVAVKVVRDELADQRQFRMRFAREVAALGSVTGPCTANLVRADTAATPQWLAMEYVPGLTMADYVGEHGPLSGHQLRLLAWALAEALNDIHRVDLIHRDLKPGNVIMSPAGPKVLDFGIVGLAEATSITESGQVLGSVAWMAPEQLLNLGETTATDVHAWGSLVYFAATGESPYGAGSPDVVAWRITTIQPDVSQLDGEDAPVVDLVRRAMAVTPSDRPSVFELLAGTRLVDEMDQTSLTNGSDIIRALAAGWSVASTEQDPELEAAQQRHLRQVHRRRRRTVLGRIGVGAVVVAAVWAGVQILAPNSGDGSPSEKAPGAGSSETSGSQISQDALIGDYLNITIGDRGVLPDGYRYVTGTVTAADAASACRSFATTPLGRADKNFNVTDCERMALTAEMHKQYMIRADCNLAVLVPAEQPQEKILQADQAQPPASKLSWTLDRTLQAWIPPATSGRPYLHDTNRIGRILSNQYRAVCGAGAS